MDISREKKMQEGLAWQPSALLMVKSEIFPVISTETAQCVWELVQSIAPESTKIFIILKLLYIFNRQQLSVTMAFPTL